MKNVTMAVVAAALAVTSCVEGSPKQKTEVSTPAEVKQEKADMEDGYDTEFKDGMVGKVFQNYLEIRTALVRSDLENAKTAASNLAEGFSAERAELRQLAREMANAESLEDIRRHFSDFSIQVENLLDESISGGTFYKQYCPMAFDNQGAFWFSDAKEIRNPYFGDQMLKCGHVEKTFTKK